MPEVSFSFAGQLRDYQIEAVDAMASRDFGTLQAPTGSGKTTMALSLIARRKQPALIVVHTRELMHQWVERIGQFLCIPANEVGLIGDGKKRIGDRITVGLVQSLLKCASEVAPHIGHLVMDECHKAPSKTFLDVVTAFDCRFMTGLSATPYRRDGLGRLIWWFIGDKVHEVPAQELQDNGSILKAEVIWRETAFSTMLDPSTQYSRMLSELCTDPQRNQLICSDVAEEIREASGVCLILSDRKSHCRDLQAMLGRMGINAALLIGDMKAKERHQVVEDLNEGRCKVVVATGQLIGEGFDCKALSTLFLACPVKFSGRMIQYLGRVLRPAPGKDRARVLDYVDPIGVLQNAARARQRVYDGAT
jgi:superfamily II DNA or RNA helicase